MSVISFMNTWVFAPALPVLLLGAGLFLAVRLSFYPLRAPRGMMRVFTMPSGDGVSPFRAVTLALAGTLGVGNIAGVASAIAAGGAGAVFWMWVSSLFSMVVKYAEILLAVRHRRRENGEWHGGAMYYFPGKILPAVFAAVCVGASFFLGNVVQVRAAAESLSGVTRLSPLCVGIAFAVLLALVVGGGMKKISDLTVRLIPLLTVGYILLSAVALIRRADALGGAFCAIFRDAFSFRAVGGGLIYNLFRFLRADSVRYGTARGIMSNEAGCGTAPMAHAAAHTPHPAAQGAWGVFEVFCDTVLLCTLTALVILVSGVPVSDVGTGMTLAIDAFRSTVGAGAGILLCVSAVLFAFATTVCWAYYGLHCLHYLGTRRRASRLYVALYAACAVTASVTSGEAAWVLSDLCVGLLTVLNTVCVCLRADEIRRDTLDYYGTKKRKRSARPSPSTVRPAA